MRALSTAECQRLLSAGSLRRCRVCSVERAIVVNGRELCPHGRPTGAVQRPSPGASPARDKTAAPAGRTQLRRRWQEASTGPSPASACTIRHQLGPRRNAGALGGHSGWRTTCPHKRVDGRAQPAPSRVEVAASAPAESRGPPPAMVPPPKLRGGASGPPLTPPLHECASSGPRPRSPNEGTR